MDQWSSANDLYANATEASSKQVFAVARGRTLRRLTGRTGTAAVGHPDVARPTLQAFFLRLNLVALATLNIRGLRKNEPTAAASSR